MTTLFITIVCCSLAAASTEVIEVTQPAFIMAKKQEPAHFMCEYKYVGNAEFRITLLRQMDNHTVKICASSFTTGYEPFNTKDLTHCQIRPSNDSVNITLWRLQSTDAGLYFCTIERILPPPYYQVMGRGTQLYVIDSEPCPDNDLYLFIVIVVASGLLVYSILVTVYLLRKAIRKSSYFTSGLYEKMVPT